MTSCTPVIGQTPRRVSSGVTFVTYPFVLQELGAY
jgi:hypothetical protein